MLRRLRRGHKEKPSKSENGESFLDIEANAPVATASRPDAVEINSGGSFEGSEAPFGLFELWPDTSPGEPTSVETVIE